MRSDTTDHINQLRNEKLDRLDRAIAATTLEMVHDTGTASSWRVYVAMHPRISFEVFKFIERTSLLNR
jgi:hypothetical protein